MTRQDYRAIAEKDAIAFAKVLCQQEFYLHPTRMSLFINKTGEINDEVSRLIWRNEDVKFSKDLLPYLREAGLTGHVTISVFPERKLTEFGIEIEVSDENFHPLLPNSIEASYNPFCMVGDNYEQIPRDASKGRYYFPSILTYHWKNGKIQRNTVKLK